MTDRYHIRRQRGAALVVGLVLLSVIFLMAITAYKMSSANLHSVGNLQFRNEAVAAANRALEQVIGSAFTNAPTAETVNVDLNNDGNVDFVVTIAQPACVQATVASATAPSSVTLGAAFATASTWNTVWDIKATVTDTISGASVEVHTGTRVLLGQAQKELVCP